MDVTKLKAVRSGHRGVITRMFKRISETEDENAKAEMAKLLQEKQKLLDKINTDTLEGLANEEDIQTEIEESDEYMFVLRLKLRELKKNKYFQMKIGPHLIGIMRMFILLHLCIWTLMRYSFIMQITVPRLV